MTRSSRRLFFFAVAFVGGLGLLAALFLLLTQSPRSIATPSPTATPASRAVATVNDEPISLDEWERAVAVDQVMSALVGQAPPGLEETWEQLVKQRLVLQVAAEANTPAVDSAQAEAWLATFLVTWDLDEATLDQALTRVDLTRADLVEEVVPRLLRVEQAMSRLSPDGDAEAWVAGLRDQAQVEVLESLSVSLPSPQPVVQPTPQVTARSTGPRVGERALDFSLPTTDGEFVSLAGLQGRPVLLNFWATWCAPCRDELPLLQTVYQAISEGQGDLVVLGINVRESPQAAIAFAAELGLDLPVLLDQDGQVSKGYRVRGLPTSLFVDREGLIAARHVGPLDRATLDAYLAPLLAEPPGSPPTP